ncbi:MAG: ABC transporter ATP-binding protein [Candidatus Rokubacteria bacterium]|nr:ABC transporter ATP-binding protein [Candidatus Rokubacteria bacterium]MBI3105376.1 ABC transporter ATP-binding protein [Candidatus Rokubacteria bacterium]
MTIRPGEVVGLIGPNGAGKTTVFNLIGGFFHADSGRVTWNGADITRLSPHEICKRGIARTFQITRPFNGLTVAEMAAAGALNHLATIEDARAFAAEVLDLLHLGDKSGRFGRDLTTPERKRLELAKALATKPSLLLLDEVMAGLLPAEVDELLSILRTVHARTGTAILVVEHVLHAVMSFCPRIVVLNFGCKLAEGTPAEISRNEEVIKAYLGRAYEVAQPDETLDR